MRLVGRSSLTVLLSIAALMTGMSAANAGAVQIVGMQPGDPTNGNCGTGLHSTYLGSTVTEINFDSLVPNESSTGCDLNNPTAPGSFSNFGAPPAIITTALGAVGLAGNGEIVAGTYHLIVPDITLDSAYLTVVVAILGTTISPYLFFWQAEEEVEDVKEHKDAKPLERAPGQAPSEFRRIRVDTYIGMALSNLVALFIMISTAATLNAHGVTDIQTSAQAAEALKPIAGQFVFLIFGLGIIGTGLLALPVLAGSAAFAMGEAFGWHVGLARKPGRAKAFYGAIAVAILLGASVNFSPIDPIKALFWSAVINGVVAVPVMAMLMLLSSRSAVMGQFTVSGPLKVVGWAATLVMAAAAIGMFATWGG